MRKGSLQRLRVVVMGLLLSLSANGCVVAQPRQAAVLTAAEAAAQTQEAIVKFYRWLRQTRQLLRRIPSHRGRPLPVQVDPETLKPLPVPDPPSIGEQIEEFFKNHLWDEFAMGEMT